MIQGIVFILLLAIVLVWFLLDLKKTRIAPEFRCSKCGWWLSNSALWSPADVEESEYLDIKCNRCNYFWKENTLDNRRKYR